MEPILQPETDYERNGNVGNITFPTGTIAEKNQQKMIEQEKLLKKKEDFFNKFDSSTTKTRRYFFRFPTTPSLSLVVLLFNVCIDGT